MRICLFTESFFPSIGGQEEVIDQLAREYISQGHEVLVLAQARKEDMHEVTGFSYPVRRFRKPFSQTWGLFCWCRALLNAYRAWPFDLVHSQSTYPTGFAAIKVCNKLNLPVVVTSHGGDIAVDSRFATRRVIMRRIRQTLADADALTALSAHMRQRFLSIAPACAVRLQSIPNGINYRNLNMLVTAMPAIDGCAQLEGERFILSLGRLDSRKAIDVLITAFTKIAEQAIDLKLVIAGRGPQLMALRQQIELAGLTQRVLFAGVVYGQAKLWLLQNALCLVIPTRSWEGMPIAVLESMACGRPVIGTRVGGIVDLVVNHHNGILVEPEDAQGLAQAIVQMYRDTAQREHWGTQARNTALAYDWPLVAAQYLQLFERLIKKYERLA